MTFLRMALVAGSLLVSSVAAAGETLSLDAGPFAAGFRDGSLVSLKRADRVLVRPPAKPQGTGIHRIGGTHWATSSSGAATAEANSARVQQLAGFTDLADGKGESRFQVDRGTGDLVVRQRTSSAAKGVWGVSWSIGEIPLDYAILVPGCSGLRLTPDAPGMRHEFDYPLTWEAQLVVVEGPGHGFYVWAEDARGRFKRLIVERSAAGWRLTLITINDAPFDALTQVGSVPWRLNVYEGDWRVAARRYREWSEAHFRPTPVEKQQPAWAKDIRGCVIMGLDRPILEKLPARFDPKQTLLYLFDWRQAGYDRDYPEYDKPVAELAPFVERAHALGFRVMLHVNYFGVDPLNSLYSRFEPYQVRDPFGTHEKQWWTWDRAKPPIRFAYINPACRAWRDLFTQAMVKLCRRTGADALHLDQTLCIYNDHNGRIDGMSMIEGNVALHQQLREALPEVALSGEGLNEVTCRHEAFAQRHVWGLDHTEGRWDRRWLAAAHPISSYLLRPYTTIYGYLGLALPEQEQLLAAWNDAYEHWGVIPTLKPTRDNLDRPTGFARQFFDELAFWQRERVQIDLDGDWPSHVAFPFRTATGQAAVRTVDGRFVCGNREISRTITGVATVEAPGTIPGWRAYDERRLLGLDPRAWYPYFDTPRDASAFHVTQLPAGLVFRAIADLGDLTVIRTASDETTIADLTTLIDRATCGARPFQGKPYEAIGPLQGDDGAQFQSQGEALFAHPVWKVAGSGQVFARYMIDLPPQGSLAFTTEVALDASAVGPDKSDGVTFGVRVREGTRELRAERHNATAERQPLTLDLTSMAGRRVTLELSVDPGPKRSPSFDWARWHRPRIERQGQTEGTMAIAGGKPPRLVFDGQPARFVSVGDTAGQVRALLPGTVLLMAKPPKRVELPVALTQQSYRQEVIDEAGRSLAAEMPFVRIQRQTNTIGGVSRPGFFAHPPNQGRTIAHFPLSLPAGPAAFRSWISIRDNTTSNGVVFIVEVNGREATRRKMQPGKWELLTVDLAPWLDASNRPDQPIVLSLVTDSSGPYDCDWACWGEPTIEKK